jgi:hypothetical protein
MTEDASDEHDKFDLKPNIKLLKFFFHSSHSTIRNSGCVNLCYCLWKTHEEELTDGNDVQHLYDHCQNRRY